MYLDNHADKTPQNETVAEKANNLTKELYRRANKELINTIENYTGGLVVIMQMWEVIDILRVAKELKKEGKGNPFADKIRLYMLPLPDNMQPTSRKAFKRAFEC